jgi:hypothetical protein
MRLFHRCHFRNIFIARARRRFVELFATRKPSGNSELVGRNPAMKKLLLFFVLFLTSSVAAHATTRTAASCSVADIQTQVNASTDGDTVLVPGGTCGAGSPVTWTTTLTINVGITLDGQGANILWPTAGPSGFLILNADTTASAFITGFTFNGGYIPGAPGCPIKLSTSNSPPTKSYRFYSNTLTNTVPQGVMLCAMGTGPGLIDHNSFTTSVNTELIQVYGVQGDQSTWTSDLVPGGSNFLFVEDNTFTNNDSTYVAGAINDYYGAKLVFRHNTLYFAAVDAHAGPNNGLNGTRWMEVYSNTFKMPTLSNQAYAYFSNIRGGSGMFYGNHVTGAPIQRPWPTFTLGLLSGSSDLQTGTWPLNYQAGRGIISNSLFTYSPYYSWGNDANMGVADNCSKLGGICSTSATYVAIGSGPTDAVNCSVHPGGVCDGVEFGPNTSTPPALKRCQSAADVAAGCPVSYTYTPYTYPHPLQGVSRNASTPPPTNLTAVIQ